MTLWFDDLQVGMRIVSPGATLTEDAIIRFALEWDFQPFHVDRKAAQESMFGGLIASGLHVLALSFRLYNESSPMRKSALVGKGFDRMQFLKPARPGDRLHVVAEIVECRLSSRGDRGHVRQHMEVWNQDDLLVATFELTSIVARRPEGHPET